MTIKDMTNIKRRLDEACEGVAETLNENLANELVVCYHSHYSKVTFSIFVKGGAEGDSKDEEFHSVKFIVNSSIDKADSNFVIEQILVLINTKEM